ncbi:hypothetical protein B0H14DRAFT_3647600 [Mycena olivaceomarginata]|nr:hypothetical protein B0H14DRAFT_3647600 [Mycena olivaceomarginata]
MPPTSVKHFSQTAVYTSVGRRGLLRNLGGPPLGGTFGKSQFFSRVYVQQHSVFVQIIIHDLYLSLFNYYGNVVSNAEMLSPTLSLTSYNLNLQHPLPNWSILRFLSNTPLLRLTNLLSTPAGKHQTASRTATFCSACGVFQFRTPKHHFGGTATHFPLWVLTYWGAVVNTKRNAWSPWRNSQQWINKYRKTTNKNPGRAALAEEASVMLAMTPWGCPKPPGMLDAEPFYTLWRFVGPHWLSGSQMNDMLELLRYKISSTPDLIRKTRIWGTALGAKIIDAYRSSSSTGCPNKTAYSTACDLRWLRDLGDDIVQNRAALITLGAPGGGHKRAALGSTYFRHDWDRGRHLLRRLIQVSHSRGIIGRLLLVAHFLCPYQI